MMTKEEERAVLLKIEKALSAAEPGGWVARAFEGCVALAHENIDYDFGCSPFDWRQGRDEARKEVERLEAELHGLNELYKRDEAQLRSRIIEKNEEISKWVEEYKKLETQSDNQSAEIIFLKDEVIRLKAKLYDMMEGANK